MCVFDRAWDGKCCIPSCLASGGGGGGIYWEVGGSQRAMCIARGRAREQRAESERAERERESEDRHRASETKPSKTGGGESEKIMKKYRTYALLSDHQRISW